MAKERKKIIRKIKAVLMVTVLTISILIPVDSVYAETISEVPTAELNKQSDVTIASLTAPLLTVDTASGEPVTTTANKSKGYQAQFSVRATDTNVGVPTVWLGYRFTMKVPDGYTKDDVMFDVNTHVWLRDMNDDSKVATGVYDDANHTWTLEGKYLYNNLSEPLGSGAAYTYSTGIAIKTGWVRENAEITPTMQVWLVDNPLIETGIGIGETTTVKNSPTLRSEMVNPINEIVTGYYDDATGQFYYSQEEVTTAGANAVQGRVFYLTGYAMTELTDANERLQANQEVDLNIPLRVQTVSGEENNLALQPQLLVAHYDSASNATKNAYSDGLKSDITFGGRCAGTSDVNNWIDANMPGGMKNVSYHDGMVKATITPDQEQTTVYYYMIVFVPVDPNDTLDTSRVLIAGDSNLLYTTAPTPGGKNYTAIDYGVERAALVKPIEGDREAFNGAYTRTITFSDSNTAYPLGAKDQVGWISIMNMKSNPIVEIKAFDALIKLDADYMTVDTSKATLKAGYNTVGLSEYPVKYGVLAGGGNWDSDTAMSNARKGDLIYYTAGNIPADSKVVALLVEARGGTKGSLGNTSIPFIFDVTEDSNLVQTVGQMTLDLDIWSAGVDPSTQDPSVKLYSDYEGSYKKDYYDQSGTMHEDGKNHVYGDSFLVTGYYTTVAYENLNGTNRPVGDRGAYTSSFDITAGERTMDIKDSVTFNYQGNPDDDPKDIEFQFCVEYPLTGAPGMVVQPDSIQLNATYTPGGTPAAAGIIQGGIRPDKTEMSADGRVLFAYFTVKGSGTYDIYASVTLGDALNPNNDLSMGTKDYTPIVYPIGKTQMLAPNRGFLWHHPSIAKSTVAGFSKISHSKVVVENGEVGYRLALSAQNRNLTGALMMDILPFNGDGRGTSISGSYTIDKPITLTIITQNGPLISNGEVYYTTDKAIQKNPLYTVNDIKGLTFHEGDVLLGVTWHKAPKSEEGKVFSYVVDPNTTAVVMTGTIGSLEAPAMDIYLQTKDMALGDVLVNDSGFSADGIGDSMFSKGGFTTIANRTIEGTAWLDANNNGKNDTNESGLAGLSIKLFQDTTEITRDAAGNTYNVVTDQDGKYVFDNIPSSPSKYHVEFFGNDLTKYTTSEKSKVGVAEDENSDVTANPSTGTMISAISDEVNLLTLEQQNATNNPLDTKRLDAGLVRRVKVSFDVKGGTPAPEIQDLLSHDLVIKPTQPNQPGFAFGGWYTDEAFTDEWNFATNRVAKDMTFYAKWTESTYTIHYDTTGGNAIVDKGVKFGDANLLPVDPVKAGFTFSGWKLKNTDTVITATDKYSNLVTDDTVKEITLVADWKENIYKVNYETGFEDVAIAAKENVKWNDSNLLPEPPQKDGYGFIGWKLADKQVIATDKYNSLTTDQTDGSSITLKADWVKLKDYSVLYNTNGGSMPADTHSSITGMMYDETIPTPTPIRTGFMFKEWTYKDASVKDGSSYKSLANDDTIKQLELVAQWEENSYTVKYDTKGGTTIDNKTGLHFDDNGLLPAKDPVKAGYTFNGWMVDDTAVVDATRYNELVADDTVKNVTLVAQWKINKYTVDFKFTSDKNPAGISVPKGVTVEYGSPTDEPKFEALDNWIFHGWYTDKECMQKYDFNTPIKGSMTLYGKWTYIASDTLKPTTPSTPDSGADAPKTGYVTNSTLFIALFGISASLVLLLEGKRKKKRDL